MKITFPAAIAALLTLAACGETASVENPNYFSFRMNDEVLTGKFNPQGFKAGQVQFYAKQNCRGKKLASYKELETLENGLIPFVATCKGGLAYDGHVSVERMENGEVLAEGTLSKGGSIFFSQKTY
ncbi:MAG: hypothetical protein AB3N24_04825 [Leisingera sp.]